MTVIARLFRLRAHWRNMNGACVCCGIPSWSEPMPERVCFNCYWRWTFDGWRPWWLRYLEVKP